MLGPTPRRGFTAQAEPELLADAVKVHVPCDFPFYSSNANLVPPICQRPDRLGRQQPWPTSSAELPAQEQRQPHLARRPAVLRRQQRGHPVAERHQGAAERPRGAAGHQLRHQPAAAVRPGRDRLRAAGHVVRAACSCRSTTPSSNPSVQQRLCRPPATRPRSASILTRRRLHQGRRQVDQERPADQVRHRGPDPPTPTTTPTPSSSRSQLNKLGFDVKVDGVGNPTVVRPTSPTATFDATIHWGNQGPNPFYYYENWMDSTLSAPIGKPAAGDYGRFTNPQAQAALAAVRRHQRPGHPEGGASPRCRTSCPPRCR